MTRKHFITVVSLLVLIGLPLAADETENMRVFYLEKSVALVMLAAAFMMTVYKSKIIREL